jgi:hypothetical protein
MTWAAESSWRRSAWLRMLAGLVALLCRRWGIRGMVRVVHENVSHAIEECDSACVPLLLFALLWLIADAPRRPSGRGRLA